MQAKAKKKREKKKIEENRLNSSMYSIIKIN